MNPWLISADERRKHDEQFHSLSPIGGFITGNQAREFFVKSKLPPATLAQIWDLSDLGKDGKMDKREFSIAMHLIQKKLQGIQLPSALPESLKTAPGSTITPLLSTSSSFQSPLSPLNVSFPSSPRPPIQQQPQWQQPMMMMIGHRTSLHPVNPVVPTNQPPPPPLSMNSHVVVDWTMPPSSRLKYSQQFNSIDKDKTGYLSGNHARSIFGHSDLPSATLARIWYISDLDRDGRLTVDEFCIASHLIDTVKQRGAQVPPELPPELAPANWQQHGGGLRLQRTCSIGGNAPLSPKFGGTSPSIAGDGELIKAPKMIVSFEDKRRQNLERGQAEIERRRTLLEEEERRQREQRERKQREERERMEREREEKERKRQLEIERHEANLRAEREKREQEFQRMLEQKETARKEAERLRKLELEQIRLQELRNQYQRDRENLLRNKGKHKTMSIQVQSYAQKTRELNDRITEMRAAVLRSSNALETMKGVRDRTLSDIERGNRRVQELKWKLAQYENEKMGLLRKRAGGSSSAVDNQQQQFLLLSRGTIETDLHSTRERLRETTDQVQRKQRDAEAKENSSRTDLNQARAAVTEYRQLIQRVNGLMTRALETRRTSGNGGYWKARGGSNGYGGSASANAEAESVNTALYQVVYDFEAANEGELTLKRGDVVTVFVDHPAQEGWLAGQIGAKVGWFPREFAVPFVQQEEEQQPSLSSVSQVLPTTAAIDNNGIDNRYPAAAGVLPDRDRDRNVYATSDHRNVESEGEWYVAVYPFTATEAGDLGFEVGENVFVVQKAGEWWTGRIGDDRVGIFPSNYVQSFEGAEESGSGAGAAEGIEAAATADQIESRVSTDQEYQQNQLPTVEVSAAPAAATEDSETTKVEDGDSDVQVQVARVIAQFQGSDENQLSLEIGDLVQIRSKSPGGWWEGEVQRKGEPSRFGWFPGNYVQVLEENVANDDDDDVAVSRQQNGEDRSSEAGAGAEQLETVEAIYDYTKQQEDELSFTRGSMIVILEKMADSWWKGRLEDGRVGLFPANYVKTISPETRHEDDRSKSRSASIEPRPNSSSAASTPTSELRKRAMSCHELEQTEHNYADDLQMVVDVFYKQFEVSGLLTPKEMSTLFVNWPQLLTTARAFAGDLRVAGEDRVGGTILRNMDNLRPVFITFCRDQQSALDYLEAKEKSSARFRAIHAQCSQHPAARGLQLSYFLLIPLARVTKYHLVVKEILKYTPQEHGDYENLRTAHSALRQLCDRVNEVATETENLQTLYWCQNHIKCDAIQPKLVFHSPTNNLGPRRFVHSGILYKAASGRLLVALLFNDFLMLTIPDEKLAQPDTFKLTRLSEVTLTLYKSPILLAKANLRTPSSMGNSAAESGSGSSSTNTTTTTDPSCFVLHTGEDVVNFRAVSCNAKTLWVKQLEKAIKSAREQASSSARSRQSAAAVPAAGGGGIGRLLLEVVFVRNLEVPQDCKRATFYIEFSLGAGGDRQKHTKSIDLTRTDTLCTTQMVLESNGGSMKLAIFAERTYSPDVCVGRTEMQLDAILKMSASQRNPAVMQLPLTSDFTAQTDAVSGHVIVKFVVQLFDVQ